MSTASVTVLAGYEPSARSVVALNTAALLLPDASAWIAHVWMPPADPAALRRMAWEAGSGEALARRIEEEGAARAARVAGSGVALGERLGWKAEPVVRRGITDPGAELVRLAAELDPDVVLVGSRGVRGAQALLGSVSDLVVHLSDRPVLVVPAATTDFAAIAGGPVIVGWDGSEGARSALAAGLRLLPGRPVVAVTAGGDAPAGAEGPGPDVEVVHAPVESHGTGHGRAVAHVLADEAADRRASVLVVGSRGRSTIAEVVLGSVALATLHQAALPVLVVPPAAG